MLDLEQKFPPSEHFDFGRLERYIANIALLDRILATIGNRIRWSMNLKNIAKNIGLDGLANLKKEKKHELR